MEAGKWQVGEIRTGRGGGTEAATAMGGRRVSEDMKMVSGPTGGEKQRLACYGFSPAPSSGLCDRCQGWL
jgi:hypothetical protein